MSHDTKKMWSVESPHCTVITTCYQTERKELVHTSRSVRVICDSEDDQSEQAQDRYTHPSPRSLWHKRLVIPAFNWWCYLPRIVTMPLSASVSCPCIRRPVHSLAVLPPRTVTMPLPGSKPTAVAIQHARSTSRACTCRASGRGFGVPDRILRWHVVAVLPAKKFLCFRDNVISNITAENHPDTFRHLHQRKNKHGIFHLRSLTKHHGRRVDTSCLWCDADCMGLHMHMSEKRQHKVSPQCARMKKKEQTHCYHRCYPRGHTASISILLVHPSRPSPSPPWLARCSSSINVRHANAIV